MNKRIIITGSEGLLGTEISRYLEESGNTVIRCDLQLGHDLTDEQFVKDFFEKNKADCLVNTYAINPDVGTEDESTNMFNIDLESLNQYLQVNLLSLFSVCREFAKNNENGSIVNFSSTYGVVSPNPALYDEGKEIHIGYCISKSGVIQMTRYLAVHLAPKFRVNCVAPGGCGMNTGEEFL